MRVVLSTYDSRGGVEPLMALAVALREAGAEATVCAPPDCAERLAEAGVRHVPVGMPVRDLVHGASPPGPGEVPRIADRLMAEQFDVLAKAADGCDVVVTSGLASVVAATRSVAELVGARSEFVHWCPIWLRPHAMPGRPLPEGDEEARWKATTESYDTLFRDALNRHRTGAGLAPVEHVRELVFGDGPWLAADPVLAPWEDEPGLVRTGAWMVRDERPLPAGLEAFLDAGTPPVHVGFGSVRAPDGFAAVAVEAVRAQGRRVVLARGWSDLAPADDGDDCYVVGEVNQQALFRRVAAVVHHGGAGTTTTAARAGAPQVVVPQIADQPYWGGRTAALGIGALHEGPVPTVESLSAALATALAPSVAARAAEVAGTIRTDGAAEAARLLLGGVG
jgi:vancomycin aglycone glucosyltransferase